MSFDIGVGAALGCAICNGVAAILQKVGADKQALATSLRLNLLVRLTGNIPYVTGVILDLIGWGLTLVAVHSLPLFLVQSLIASSIVVTAIGEQILSRRVFARQTYLAITLVVVGLVLLGMSATSQKAESISSGLRAAIIIAPVPLAALGAIAARHKQRSSAIILAALSGIAFGGTSVAGRILIYDHSVWYYLTNPLIWALLAYGLLGILLFTVALQRALATKVNAVMLATDTLVPAIIGLSLFGDKVKHGWLPALVVGAALALTGALITALASSNSKTLTQSPRSQGKHQQTGSF